MMLATLNVNARMRTEIDLNESGIDLNECEHFLKAKLGPPEIRSKLNRT